MKRLSTLLLITILGALFVINPAFASQGALDSSCPPNFELHHFMDHTGEHMHQHIGVDQDLNGDGKICMKMLPNDLHLHVDNFLPSFE